MRRGEFGESGSSSSALSYPRGGGAGARGLPQRLGMGFEPGGRLKRRADMGAAVAAAAAGAAMSAAATAYGGGGEDGDGMIGVGIGSGGGVENAHGSRTEMSMVAEAAAVTAALDVFSLKRSQSLPETELAAIVDAVDAATDAASMFAAGHSPSVDPRGSPKSPLGSNQVQSQSHGHDEVVEDGRLPGHGSDRTASPSGAHLAVGGGGGGVAGFLHHISEGNSLDEASEGKVSSTDSESRAPPSIDLETASRGDLAAEVRRLQERLALLENQTR